MSSTVQTSTGANIHSLPYEVLLMVLARHSVEKTDGPYHHSVYTTWLSITHVCQRWRNLLVNTPSFWTFISVQRASWTKMCLSRSTGKTISAHIMWSDFDDESAKLLLRHLPRVRKLVLEEIPSKRYRVACAPSLKLYSADELEELDIYAPDDRRMVVRIDDAIFRGHAPKLRKLSLGGESLRFSWDSHLLTAKLSYISLERLYRPSMSLLLPFLERNSPTLTYLKIRSALQSSSLRSHFQTSVFDVDQRQRVSLPRLEVLDIADRALGAAHLLCNLDIPSLTLKYLDLYVDSSVSATDLGNIGQALSIVLPALFPPAPSGASSSMHIVNSDNELRWKIEPPLDEIHIGQVDEYRIHRYQTTQTLAHHTFRIGSPDKRDISALLKTVTASFAVCSSISSLRLELGPRVSANSWTKLFSNFMTVSQLTLDRSTASSFTHTLADIGPQALPRLRSIIIEFPQDSPQDSLIPLLQPLRKVLSWCLYDTANITSISNPESTMFADQRTKQMGIKLVLDSCPRASELVAQLDAVSAHPVELATKDR